MSRDKQENRDRNKSKGKIEKSSKNVDYREKITGELRKGREGKEQIISTIKRGIFCNYHIFFLHSLAVICVVLFMTK